AAPFGVRDQHVRNRLVERIARLGVVPHRVEIREAKGSAGAIAIAAAISETIEALAVPSLAIVMGAAIPPTEVVRLRCAVGRHHSPSSVVALLPYTAQAVQRDTHAESCGLDNELTFIAHDANIRTTEARHIHAVSS